jgi:tetratricopeptide (TPR) repeat protein
MKSRLVILLALVTLGCSNSIPHFGTGGLYLEGREQFLRGRAGDMDRAIVALESLARQYPTYKDTLTYLGRAYYRKGRYQDAQAILQRAVAVNRDDEMAWLALGLTQLRLNQNETGLDTLKGGITLASKVMVEGYHNYERWDIRGLIRASIRRSAFLLAKGIDEKNNIIEINDRLMAQVDDEENFQRNSYLQNVAPLYR